MQWMQASINRVLTGTDAARQLSFEVVVPVALRTLIAPARDGNGVTRLAWLGDRGVVPALRSLAHTAVSVHPLVVGLAAAVWKLAAWCCGVGWAGVA